MLACVLAFTLIPGQVGFQDLGALMARQPGVAARAHKHVIASPFGTIHAATFSMPRPIGTTVPHPPLYALANFDPAEIAVSIGRQWLGDPNGPLQFPSVNREAKRDSMIARGRDPMPPLAIELSPDVAAKAPAPAEGEDGEGRIDPYAKYQFAAPAEPPPAAAPAEAAATPPPAAAAPVKQPEPVVAPVAKSAPAKSEPVKPVTPKPMLAKPVLAKRDQGKPKGAKTAKTAERVYFGSKPMVEEETAITPWAPGEAPMVKPPAVGGDPDIKLAALSPSAKTDGEKGGESIANKGQVTGPGQRPYTPAERLALTGEAREKADKCLANGIYFESRGEGVRGQIAVAQVIMNRVFSPFYPNDVCGVVYQNVHRRHACQFSFACDGVPDVVTEPDAFARAMHIARDMIDGKLWMPQVAKSTHYHAYWVSPGWTNEMKKIYKFGVHIFYRPLAWGDGADEPTWGDPKATEEQAVKLEEKWPVSYSREWLRSQGG